MQRLFNRYHESAMRVGIYQNHPAFGEVRANVEKAVQDLSPVQADLIVLPELFNTGYQFVSSKEIARLAEEIPSGKTCRTMLDLARSAKTVLVFGLAEKEGECYFNSAAVMGPDGFIGKYRKTHLFFEEKDYFTAGDTGFPVFDLGPARIGHQDTAKSPSHLPEKARSWTTPETSGADWGRPKQGFCSWILILRRPGTRPLRNGMTVSPTDALSSTTYPDCFCREKRPGPDF